MIQAVYIGTGIIHELYVTSSQNVLPPRQGLVTARSTLHHVRGSVQEYLTEIATLRINSYILLRTLFCVRRRSSQKQNILDGVMRTSYQDLPQDEDDGSPGSQIEVICGFFKF